MCGDGGLESGEARVRLAKRGSTGPIRMLSLGLRSPLTNHAICIIYPDVTTSPAPAVPSPDLAVRFALALDEFFQEVIGSLAGRWGVAPLILLLLRPYFRHLATEFEAALADSARHYPSRPGSILPAPLAAPNPAAANEAPSQAIASHARTRPDGPGAGAGRISGAPPGARDAGSPADPIGKNDRRRRPIDRSPRSGWDSPSWPRPPDGLPLPTTAGSPATARLAPPPWHVLIVAMS